MVRYKQKPVTNVKTSRAEYRTPSKQGEPSSSNSKQETSHAKQWRKGTSISGSRSKPKKRRFQSGQVALREIQMYQDTYNLLIPRLPFANLVRELIGRLFGDDIADFRIERLALDALQEASEAYLVQFFEDCLLCSVHANRRTILPRDVHLVRRIRGQFKN